MSEKRENNRKKQISFCIVFFFFTFSVYTQTEYHFVVKFNSKSNSSLSINTPEDYLSLKAIDRRYKHNVDVSTEDLPIDSSNFIAVKGFKIEAKSKWFNLVVINSSDSLLAVQLAINSSIDTVIYIGSKDDASKKPVKNWNYGIATNQTNMLDGKYLHQKGYTGNNVLIGIIDVGFSGVDVINPFDSFHKNDQLISTYDFVENEEDVYDDPSHGTSVLSTISSFEDSLMIGTAPSAEFILLVSEDDSQENLIEEFYYIEALEFADSCGVDIINTSLGYSYFDTPKFSHKRNELTGDSAWITKATNIASRKGILMVTSAGNSGGSSWQNLTFPGDADSVLTVGAVDRNENIASFSSTGIPSIHYTIKPNVVALGQQTSLMSEDGTYISGNGTSFSSPQIAGLSACLMQAFPNETAWRIKRAIEFSAHQYLDPDSLLGYGIPNFKKAYLYLKYDTLTELNHDVLELFPNPSKGEVTIVSSLNIDQVKVFDDKGLIVFNQSVNGKIHSFNFDFLIPSCYFIQFITGEDLLVRKFIKI